MLMNRWPCSLLDQSWPDATRVVRCSQEKQKSHHELSWMLILECWLSIIQSWLGTLFKVNHLLGYSGKVTACTGPLSYKVRLTNGCIIHHCADHLRHAARQLPVIHTDSDGWTICSHFLTPFLMDRLSRKIIRENCLNILREPNLTTPGEIFYIITGGSVKNNRSLSL